MDRLLGPQTRLRAHPERDAEPLDRQRQQCRTPPRKDHQHSFHLARATSRCRPRASGRIATPPTIPKATNMNVSAPAVPVKSEAGRVSRDRLPGTRRGYRGSKIRPEMMSTARTNWIAGYAICGTKVPLNGQRSIRSRAPVRGTCLRAGRFARRPRRVRGTAAGNGSGTARRRLPGTRPPRASRPHLRPLREAPAGRTSPAARKIRTGSSPAPRLWWRVRHHITSAGSGHFEEEKSMVRVRYFVFRVS